MLKSRNKNQTAWRFICILLAVTALLSCFMLSTANAADTTSQSDNTITSAKDIPGKKVGVQLGTTGDLYVSDPKNVENVTVQQFPKGADAVEALKTDKIDAVVIDNQPAKKFVENNSDIEILATPLTQESYAIAVAKDNKQLLDAVNKALAELKESGELDSILNKYLASDESAETTTSAQ